MEHAFLTHCTRYLTDGGLLLFIVPKQRLSVSARYLSSHYRDIRCWAFPNPEREVFAGTCPQRTRRVSLNVHLPYHLF